MFSVENETRLPVPPAQAWRVVADVDQYEIWHPYLTLKRDPDDPAKLFYTHRRGHVRRFTIDADLVRLEPPRAIAWKIGVGRLLELEESIDVEVATGGTRLRHGIRCSGLASRLVPPRLRKGLLAMLVAIDTALSAHLKHPAATLPRPPASKRKTSHD